MVRASTDREQRERAKQEGKGLWAFASEDGKVIAELSGVEDKQVVTELTTFMTYFVAGFVSTADLKRLNAKLSRAAKEKNQVTT